MAQLSLKNQGFSLALGGGGALGMAHIGILEELSEHGLLPAAVAGTSMGALVGAAWCLGEPSIWQPIKEAAWSTSFWLAVATRGATLRRRLKATFGDARLGDCRVPLAVCAARTNAPHEPVYFEDLDLPLWLVVAASTALPLAFAPVRVGEQRYLDGGCADNLPCAPLRRYGLPVVGVELGFLEGALRGDTQPSRRVQRLLARLGIYARYRDLGDYLAKPRLDGLGPQSFSARNRIIAAGAECVREALGNEMGEQTKRE